MLEIGSSLRAARSRRGLELEEAEAAIMIRARYLEALEDEQFDLLPAGAYRRSFLREYASFLGLDGDVYAAEYQDRFEAPEPEPEPPSRAADLGRLARLPSGRVVALLAGLALAGIAVWQLGGSGASHRASPPPRTVSRPPPAHRLSSVRRAPPTRPPPTPAARPVLVLTAARGDCWLSVHVGSSLGRTVYERTLLEGQTLRFGLRRALWIRIGAPWNLSADLGKRTITGRLPSQTGDVTATADGLRSAP
jgi:hypothetical protein